MDELTPTAPTSPWTGHASLQASHRTRQGFLVLADISGFTAFVTATELAHAPPIIAALLEEVIRRISPPLDLQEVEGDAVFALGPHGHVRPPAALLDVLDASFVGFRRLQRTMAADESCSCKACRSIGQLRLKIVGHYGTFLQQTVGGRAQAAGRDVVLARGLLKNAVAGPLEYALLTRAAVEYMQVDPARAGLAAHVEQYEHFGEVECFVADPRGARLPAVVAGEAAPRGPRVPAPDPI